MLASRLFGQGRFCISSQVRRKAGTSLKRLRAVAVRKVSRRGVAAFRPEVFAPEVLPCHGVPRVSGGCQLEPAPCFLSAAAALCRLRGTGQAGPGQNISAGVNDAIAGDLRRVTKPGGLLLLAGFMRENPPKRFRPFAAREQGDWLCWSCRPENVAPGIHAGPQLHPQH
jgi:hypothetical protein